MDRRFTAFLLAIFLLAPPSVFAQDNRTDEEKIAARMRELERAQIQEEARRAEETRRMFDRMTDQQLGPPSSFNRSKDASERAKFYETVPLFREATSRYREAMGIDPDLKEPAKGIEKLIDPLQDYFNTMKFKREPVNLAEFQNLSPEQLSWETLTMAERVDNNLQLARQFVQQSERDGAIDIRVLEFFKEIQDDMSRLKWLADRMSEARRPHPDTK